MNVAPGIDSSDIENLISQIKNREGSHYFPPDERDEWLDEAAHFLTIMLIRIKEECDDGIEVYNS